MDADSLQDETLLLDRFHAEDSSSLSESAPSGLHPTVVPALLSHRLTRMASMAQFVPNQFRTNDSDDSSDNSCCPECLLSLRVLSHSSPL